MGDIHCLAGRLNRLQQAFNGLIATGKDFLTNLRYRLSATNQFRDPLGFYRHGFDPPFAR